MQVWRDLECEGAREDVKYKDALASRYQLKIMIDEHLRIWIKLKREFAFPPKKEATIWRT